MRIEKADSEEGVARIDSRNSISRKDISGAHFSVDSDDSRRMNSLGTWKLFFVCPLFVMSLSTQAGASDAPDTSKLVMQALCIDANVLGMTGSSLSNII